MNNHEAKKTILEAESCFCKHGAYKDCHSGCKYREALDTAVEAMDKLEKVKAAMEQIAQERDKSYEGEAIGHGWGMQSALEILERAME